MTTLTPTTARRKFRVFRENGLSIGSIVCELYARDETDALLSTSWGYSAARFDRDFEGRPAMLTATDVYRAECIEASS